MDQLPLDEPTADAVAAPAVSVPAARPGSTDASTTGQAGSTRSDIAASPAVPAGSVRLGADPDALVDELADWVVAPLSDPFAAQLVVTSGAGASRWVSQRIGARAGICAGVDFLTTARLRQLLLQRVLDVDPLADPWSAPALTLRLVGLLERSRGQGWAGPLEAHLWPTEDSQDDPRLAQRPGRTATTAEQLARLLLHYSRRIPEQLDAWDRGEPLGPDGAPLTARQRWQYELWRRLREDLTDPHPAARQRRLLEALTSPGAPGLHDLPWERAAILGLGVVDPDDRALLKALPAVLPTATWQSAVVRADRGALHRLSLAQRLQRGEWESPTAVVLAPPSRPATLLGRLQTAIGEGEDASGPADDSITFHACHSDERQVQVLRDLLCGLFVDDPGLEPRDVVVVVPDLDRFAPLLTAQFGALQDVPAGHPGHGLRVQLPPASGQGASSVVELVVAVLDVLTGRATAEDLVELCLAPPLAHRFGISPDDADTVRRLVRDSAIRWGLDRRSRSEAGLAQVGQGTWLSGVERLVTGSVFADSPLTWVGSALPVGGLEADDLRVVGILAELLSRLRKTRIECSSPATAREWAARLETIIDLFADLPYDRAWAINIARAGIRRWATAAPADDTQLDLPAVRSVVAGLAASWSARPSFGNGNLLVVGPQDLRGVPHRVVAILGLDDQSFPQRPQRHGNDLIAEVDHDRLAPHTWRRVQELDARVRSQGALVDALMSAADRVLITYQGFDHRTGEAMDPPVTLAELAHDLTALVDPPIEPFDHRHGGDVFKRHQLHAHGELNFRLADDHTPPFSFDERGLDGARALLGEPVGPDPAQVDLREWRRPPGEHSHDADAVALADLLGFWRHPAKDLLRRSVGTTLGRNDRIDPVTLPVELRGLDAYTAGVQMLDQLRSGVDVDRAVMAARLGGAVPPGALGDRDLEQLRRTTSSMVEVLGDIGGSERDVAVDLDLGEERITGSIRVTGQTLVDVSWSQLNGPNLVGVWLQLLTLAASEPGPWSARVVHKDARRVELAAPAADRAVELLRGFVHQRRLGGHSVLVAPLRTVFTAAKERGIWRATQLRPYDSVESSWRHERDADWQPFTPERVDQLFRLPVHPELPSTVGQLAGQIFEPIARAVR